MFDDLKTTPLAVPARRVGSAALASRPKAQVTMAQAAMAQAAGDAGGAATGRGESGLSGREGLLEVAAGAAYRRALLRVTLDSVGDAVLATNAAGLITALNPPARRLTGWAAVEAKGLPLDDVLRLVDATGRPCVGPVARCLALGRVTHADPRPVLIARDGRRLPIEARAVPVRSAAGDVLGAVLVLREAAASRPLAPDAGPGARQDPLTGLINRAEFEARLRQALSDTGTDHTLLLIDLDQFKLVNDSCGHAVGDRVLEEIGQLLARTVRGEDTLARLRSDEFAVILPHCGGEQGLRMAQHLCDELDRFRFSHDGRRFRFGASIGLVPLSARWASPVEALQAADSACYAAKEAGRNRVHVWFESDQALLTRIDETQWATRIEQALDEDRFALFAQRIEPTAGAAAGRPGRHAEVLVRMVDAGGALIPPGAFLPAAERFHLASRLDRWVLRHTIAWLRQHLENSDVSQLSVNLSGRSIGDRSFHRMALQKLADAGAAACRRLCIEITETAAITNLADAASFIHDVRQLGVRVALDDFGAGAASFGYLKSLAVDTLKIDGQFITTLLHEPLANAAVRCFVDVARVMGLTTVAEFVDDPAVLVRLREIGVDFAQGFLIHRPEPIDALLAGCAAPAAPGRPDAPGTAKLPSTVQRKTI